MTADFVCKLLSEGTCCPRGGRTSVCDVSASFSSQRGGDSRVTPGIITVVTVWCGARSNRDGQCWLGGSLFQAQGWRELPVSEDQIDAGSGLPALEGVAGGRGQWNHSRQLQEWFWLACGDAHDFGLFRHATA
jgi:hypothetical protein